MTAIMNQPGGYEIGRQTSAGVREKINKPTLRVELKVGPEMALALSAPVAVGAAMLMGWVMLTSMGAPVYGAEMAAGAIVNVVGGILAILPVLAMMKQGTGAIAKGAILGIGIRSGAVLMGVMLALGPGWGLAKMPLVYWVLGCYFPMLIVETGMLAWLCRKARN